MRLLRKATATRRRTVFTILSVVALIAATAAFAAWVTGSGSGTAKGRGAATQEVVLVITPGTPPTAGSADTLGPADTGRLFFNVSNPSIQLTITSVVKSGPASVVGLPACDIDSHITVDGNGLVGQALFPGANNGVFVAVTSDATLPSCAANAELDVPITMLAASA